MGQTLSNPPPNVRLPPWGSRVQIVSCHLKWPNNQSGSFCSVVPDRLSGDCQFLGSSRHPRCIQCHHFRPRFARDCCHRRCQRWRASKESCWRVCWCLPPSTSHISDLSSCHNCIPHRSRNWHLQQSNNCVMRLVVVADGRNDDDAAPLTNFRGVHSVGETSHGEELMTISAMFIIYD